jgi:hypothetical protein
VYLTDGGWRGTLARTDRAPVTFAVTIDGQPCATDGERFTTPVQARGWHKLVITALGAAPSLTSLTLTRE